MAKFKKMVKQVNLMERRMNNLVAMLAVTAHKNGGKLTITKEDMESLPEVGFGMEHNEGTFTVTLKYNNELAEKAPS
jgi:hypothetical protein